MYELNTDYLEKLETLAAEIQESDELNAYLDSEEDDDYNRLKELYEPKISLIYQEVAQDYPLQLVALELVLLDPAFEGLFLPKILGFSVLRGEINGQYKYTRPQDHFQDVLLAICNSANFDILKKRIGQSIQIGFALSSDIWVTNLINSVENKKVRYYLQSQKLDRFRDPEERATGYRRYARQFENENFLSAFFPEEFSELKVLFSPLKHFLIYRINLNENNASLLEPLRNFIRREDFQGSREHLEILGLFGYFYALDAADQQIVAEVLKTVRKEHKDFDSQFIDFIESLHSDPEIDLDPDAEKRFSSQLDHSQKGELSEYYDLMDEIHSKGYTHEAVHEAIKKFYNKHKGLSQINECVRRTIFHQFRRFISNLEPTEYNGFFDITKLYPVYMTIFANQQFNQDLKELSMDYVRKLLKKFTDKRGKDYQDIKKFVSNAFLDLGFLNDKAIVELFKTRRKKKAKPA